MTSYSTKKPSRVSDGGLMSTNPRGGKGVISVRVARPNPSIRSVNEEFAILVGANALSDVNCFSLGVGYTVCP